MSHSALDEDAEVQHGYTIGVEMEGQNFNYQTFKYDMNNQPDKIAILADETQGQVCDVVLYSGKIANHLSNTTDSCQPD